MKRTTIPETVPKKFTEIIEQQSKELNSSNHGSELVTTVPGSNTSAQTSRDSKDLFSELIMKVPTCEKFKTM